VVVVGVGIISVIIGNGGGDEEGIMLGCKA